jgi:asparagine synthase (glutamine-hydrolysing)
VHPYTSHTGPVPCSVVGEALLLSEGIEELAREILATLGEIVQRERPQSLLLSGGVDTSLLAYAASRYYRPTALTVTSKHSEAPDLRYARMVATTLGLKHEVVELTREEAVSLIRPVVKVTRSFDPMEIRGSIPLYAGLLRARDMGFESIMLGFGGDELFAGYPYMISMDAKTLKEYIEYISRVMDFFSRNLADSVGIRVVEPFRDPRMVSLALKIDPTLKVREVDGKRYGKWILRVCLQGVLPDEVVWRQKENIGTGSGFGDLGSYIASLVSDEEYRALTSRAKGRPRDREQAYYLKVLLEEVGGIPQPRPGEKECPYCGAGVAPERTYCRTCGSYPV